MKPIVGVLLTEKEYDLIEAAIHHMAYKADKANVKYAIECLQTLFDTLDLPLCDVVVSLHSLAQTYATMWLTMNSEDLVNQIQEKDPEMAHNLMSLFLKLKKVEEEVKL